MASASTADGLVGRMRNATGTLHDHNQSLATEILKAFGMLKSVAVALEKVDQHGKVNELENAAIEFLEPYEACTLFSKAIKSVGKRYEPGLEIGAAGVEYSCSQDMDYFLVLDLEGKDEILKYPVLIVNDKTLDVMNLFHRFVRHCQMSELRVNEYIEDKYGKLGVDQVWHDTAITFEDVIKQFEAWLSQNRLWSKEQGGRLNRAAFVTCGYWDLKTKVPLQCKASRIKLPPYFMEWINLKDVYLKFYHREARGMMPMMKQLGVLPLGSQHLGIHDTKNIARVLQRMLLDGAPMRITAWKNPGSPPNAVQFVFENRI